MPKGSGAQRTSSGLLPQQEEFLEALGKAGTWAVALELCGFTRRRVTRWFREDEAFRNAYTEKFGDTIEMARKAMESTATEALETVLAAQAARKPLVIDLVCPFCGKGFKEKISIEDWATRLKAGALILKGTGVIIDRKKVEVEVTELSWPEKMALAILHADPHARVPPAMIRKFQQLNLLPEGHDEEIIEGEVREVE